MPLIDVNDSFLLVVDVQEKLFPRVSEHDVVLEKILFTINGVKIFNTPILVTEQNPDGLGPTIAQVESALPRYNPDEKKVFNAFACTRFAERVEHLGRGTVVLVGIETHICILQTAIEALDRGMNVYVVADAVGSMDPEDHRRALDRVGRLGAAVTTSQSLIYEMMRDAGDPRFSDLLEMIKSGRRRHPVLYSFEETGGE